MDTMITKVKPRSLQSPSVYLTRSLFRFADPTGFSPNQWRMIAREPVNKMAQRFIIREVSALSWEITSSKRNDPRIDEYTETWNDLWEGGDGFAIWLSRMIEDACTLPFGAASEVGYRGDALEWVLHVDGATLLPTYEIPVPYVQVNPDNMTQRVYFKRGQLQRLRVNPRPDIRYKPYQVAPTEDAFLGIEALSKIYLYYMQELTDTPPMGILDMMDYTETEATAWAKNFREMVEGIDPLKVPILYDHKTPAQFIPFGRSPQDLNVVEQFKRFAEMVLGKYGLSIGDLRLFAHESTKAGERVSQLVTERSGIGFWSVLIAMYVTTLLPDGLTFGFKQPRPEREKVEAERKATQLRMLQEATGAKALISVEDAVQEAQALELFSTQVKPLKEEEQKPPPPNGGPPTFLPQPDDEAKTDEEQDADDDEDLTKSLVLKALGEAWRHPDPPASERLGEVMADAFRQSATAINEAQISGIMSMAEDALALMAGQGEEEVELKGGPGSGNFAHAGRPGSRGGSAGGGGGRVSHDGPRVVYHGTAAWVTDSIKSDGLRRGETWGDNPPSVYFGDSEDIAHFYGGLLVGDNYAIVEFEIPKSAQKFIVSDPEQEGAWRLEQDVSPKSIKVIRFYKDGVEDESMAYIKTEKGDIKTGYTAIVIISDDPEQKGGPGSGNWGHTGRPGSRGGSASGGGLAAVGADRGRRIAGRDSGKVVGSAGVRRELTDDQAAWHAVLGPEAEQAEAGDEPGTEQAPTAELAALAKAATPPQEKSNVIDG